MDKKKKIYFIDENGNQYYEKNGEKVYIKKKIFPQKFLKLEEYIDDFNEQFFL